MTAYRAELIHALLNIFCILSAFVILHGSTRDVGSENEVKYYRGLVWCYIGFAASNVYWLFRLMQLGDFLMLVLNAVNISFMLGIVSFWSIYAESKLAGSDKEIPLMTVLIIQVPLAALVLMTWVSIHTGNMFYVENHDLVQGRFYIAIIITIALLFIMVTVHAAREYSKTTSISRKTEYRSLVLFPVMPLIAGVMDSFLPNLPLMTPSVFFSILLIFVERQGANIFNDSLTGMYNRRYAQDYMSAAIKEADSKPFFFIMLDARKFDNVNDIYGHLQGDRVLKIMARALEDYARENDCLASRWGGDEFVLIMDKDRCPDPDDVIHKVNRLVWDGIRLADIHVDVTFDGGYCLCDSSKLSTDDILNKAENMIDDIKEEAKATPGI